MFKKIESANIDSEIKDSTLNVIYRPTLPENCRVKNAIIKLKLKNVSNTYSGTVSCNSKIIDKISPSVNQKFVCINITEELCEAINDTLTLSFSDKDSISFILDQSYVIIDYIPKNLALENNVYKEIDAGRAGQGRLNLSTGDLEFTHRDASIKSGALTLGISHTFNPYLDNSHLISEQQLNKGFGHNWKLNMQQYLLRESIDDLNEEHNSKIFSYLDGNGNRHIFKEKYYYLDAYKSKHYVDISKVNIDENQNLYYYNANRKYKVEKEVVTSSGMTLVSQLEGFKGIKHIQTEIDEIAQVKDSIKQLKSNINDLNYNITIDKQKICLFALNKKALDVQNNIQKVSAKDTKKRNELEKMLYQAQQALEKIETKRTNFIEQSDKSEEEKDKINSNVFNIVYNNVERIISNPDIKVAYSNDPNAGSDAIYFNEDVKIDTDGIKYFAVKKYIEEKQKETTWGDSNEGNFDEPNEGSLKYYQKKLTDYTEDLSNENTLKELKEFIKEYLKLNDSGSIYSIEESDLDMFFDSNELHKIMSLNEVQISQLDLDINQIFRDLKSSINLKVDYENELVKFENELRKLELRVPVHYLNDENGTTFGFARFNNGRKNARSLSIAENVNFQAETDTEDGVISQNKTNISLIEESTFNPEGEIYRLVMVADKWENVIYFEYNDENQIERIVGDKSAVSLKYDSNTGMLISLTDDRGRETKYEYDSRDRLTTIIYNDESKSALSYNNASYLISSVFAPNGYGVKLRYSLKSQIVEIAEQSKARSIRHNRIETGTSYTKSKIQLDYINSRATTVTEENGKQTTYLFDSDGRPITVYEKKAGLDSCLAKTFDYSNGKVTYSSTPITYGKDYLQNVCYINRNGDKVCQHEFGAENYFGNNLGVEDIEFGDSLLPILYEVESSDTVILNPLDEKIYKNVDVEQIINSGKKDFVLTAWAKADSAYATRRCTCFGDRASDDAVYDDLEKEFLEYADSIQMHRRFELGARLTYRNTKNNEQITEEVYTSFDWQQQEWQYCALPIVLSEDPSYILENLLVYVDYTLNTNQAQIKNMQLKEGDWEYSEYNSDGAKTYAESSKSQYTTEYVYDNDKNLIKVVMSDASGRQFITTYDYNALNALIRTVDYNGIVNETEYNDKGIAIKNITYHQDEPSSKYYDESVLDEKGFELGKVNEFGEKICDYTNIPNTDIVSVSTDKNGEQIAYGYDHNDDTLLSVSASVDGQQNSNVIGYTADTLTKLTHNGIDINYSYYDYGQHSEVDIAGNKYMTSDFRDDIENKRKTVSKQYFKDDDTYYNYESISDIYGKISEVKYCQYNDRTPSQPETVLRYGYDSLDRLIMTEDLTTNIQQIIDYDDQGNEHIREYHNENGGLFAVENNYDKQGNIIENKLHLSSGVRSTIYSYDNTPDRRLSVVTLPNGVMQTPVYDKLGRLSGIGQKKSGNSFGKDIYYKQVGDHTSELVASEWFEKNGVRKERLAYSYDEKGNIMSIKENNTIIVRYAYDSLSRLVREDNKKLDKTTIVAYDSGGNITSRVEYKYSLAETSNLESGNTYNYEYAAKGWRDQLRSYNGAVCDRYDNLGNPAIYRGKTLRWSHGRQLDVIGDVIYQYNANGVRIAKTANGITTKFYVDGTTILAQEVGNRLMLFTHGIDGLNGFTLSGTEYIYKKNIQGDIVAIMDASGDEIVRYVYDAWGNHEIYVLERGAYKKISEAQNSAYVEIAQLNPFRYRGYYYDIETGLYYLNTRYYDPEVGRFINADDISKVDSKQINGLNLYAYCFNNPVYNIDPTGHKGKWWQWLIVGLLVAASVVLIVSGIGAAVVAATATTLTVAQTATLTIVGATALGMGLGAAASMDASINQQGGIMNADPGVVINATGVGMLKGATVGFFSGVMALTGTSAGTYAGLSLGNMTHIYSGIKVGKVISTTLLMKSLSVVGGVTGGLIGSAFGEHLVNLATGNSNSADEYTKKSIEDEWPMWLVNIIRWFIGLF